jgi:hypothetical protein
MAEDETTQQTQDMPAVEEVAPPVATSSGQSPLDAHAASDSADDPLPLVGAAFAGGFVLAKILKRLGGGD